ncbi:MAG: hypothetical protein R6V05_12415 [Candidatus Brocadiia bacterium]
MSQELTVGLLLFAMAVLVAGWVVRDWRRAEALLRRWAEGEGCQLLHYERRFIRRGSLTWLLGDKRAVFYVVVADAEGRRRTGYVRCGTFLFGTLLSDAVTVDWLDADGG